MLNIKNKNLFFALNFPFLVFYKKLKFPLIYKNYIFNNYYSENGFFFKINNSRIAFKKNKKKISITPKLTFLKKNLKKIYV